MNLIGNIDQLNIGKCTLYRNRCGYSGDSITITLGTIPCYLFTSCYFPFLIIQAEHPR